jgi:hypothetical protein
MTTIAPSILVWGEGRGIESPRYWLADAAASDDGDAFGIAIESNEITPAGFSGECLFTGVSVTIRAAAGAILKVYPIIDDAQVDRLHPAGTLTLREPRITIPQQEGGPPTPMALLTFFVPFWQRLVKDGRAVGVWYPRGASCRVRFETEGEIGTGAFRVEHAELEYEVVRRSNFEDFTP